MAITQTRATPSSFAGFELNDVVYTVSERLRAFTRNQTAGAISFLILLCLIFVAVAAPWIAPYDP